MALLAHGVTCSDATMGTCDGVISSFTGDCTYTNFVNSLSSDCVIDQLFPVKAGATSTTEAEVTKLCIYDSPINSSRFKERTKMILATSLESDSWLMGELGHRFDTDPAL